jgi:hypothetical protein
MIVLLVNSPAETRTLVVVAVCSIVTSVTVLLSLVLLLRGQRRAVDTTVAVSKAVANVQTAVDTGNSQTLGQLGDAAETRRVGEIPVADRTAQEAQHIAAMPPDHKT